MRHPTPQSPVRRTAAALLIASLLVPAAGWAQFEKPEPEAAQPAPTQPAQGEPTATPAAEQPPEPQAAPAVEEATPAQEAAPTPQAEAEAQLPPPVEPTWDDTFVRNSEIGADLLIVRPLSAVTLLAGGVLFVPAALMTAPNGMDSVRDAYDRFVREPGEYFYARPLGEF